jgi:hypothetical protein
MDPITISVGAATVILVGGVLLIIAGAGAVIYLVKKNKKLKEEAEALQAQQQAIVKTNNDLKNGLDATVNRAVAGARADERQQLHDQLQAVAAKTADLAARDTNVTARETNVSARETDVAARENDVTTREENVSDEERRQTARNDSLLIREANADNLQAQVAESKRQADEARAFAAKEFNERVKFQEEVKKLRAQVTEDQRKLMQYDQTVEILKAAIDIAKTAGLTAAQIEEICQKQQAKWYETVAKDVKACLVEAVDSNLIDIFTLEPLADDCVVAGDGHTYSRDELAKWYAMGNRTCPLDPSQPLADPATLKQNHAVRKIMSDLTTQFGVFAFAKPAEQNPVNNNNQEQQQQVLSGFR